MSLNVSPAGGNSAAALHLPVHQSHGIAAMLHTACYTFILGPILRKKKSYAPRLIHRNHRSFIHTIRRDFVLLGQLAPCNPLRARQNCGENQAGYHCEDQTRLIGCGSVREIIQAVENHIQLCGPGAGFAMHHQKALTIEGYVESLAKSRILDGEQLPFARGAKDSSYCRDVDRYHGVALAKKEFTAIS